MKKLIPVFLCAVLLAGCYRTVPGVTTAPVPETTAPTAAPQPTQSATESTLPPTQPTQPTNPAEPQPQIYTLSFAGDCTFGNQLGKEDLESGFLKVVGENYDYPLSNVKDIFLKDDFTFVNLECALTEHDPDEEEMQRYGLVDKEYRFRGPAAYAKILSHSGVEFASTANNHIYDFGFVGYKDTVTALDAEGILRVDNSRTVLAVTDSDLKIGIISIQFNCTKAEMQGYVRILREQGAELLVLSIHWGDEGTYMPNARQRQLGYMAIDCGVNIIHGHHSHTLQPVEYYHGGMIYYSLGNFSFGGNIWPSDKDTAIIQQQVVRESDGSIHLGAVNMIPCRVSSGANPNDFRPTPYKAEDPAFFRVIDKLSGTFVPAN